jgi:hypothetical protein
LQLTSTKALVFILTKIQKNNKGGFALAIKGINKNPHINTRPANKNSCQTRVIFLQVIAKHLVFYFEI